MKSDHIKLIVYVDVNLHSDFGAFNSMHLILYMHCDLYTEGLKPRNTPLQQTVYLRRSRVSIEGPEFVSMYRSGPCTRCKNRSNNHNAYNLETIINPMCTRSVNW